MNIIDEQSDEFEKLIVDNKAIQSLIADTGEVIIDKILADGILKDIPFINTITNTVKAGIAISERVFIKKVLNMVFELKDISEDAKVSFIIELEDYSGQRAGDLLITALDKHDHLLKSSLYGKLIIAKIENKVDIDMFLRLNEKIERTYYYDLIKLPEYRNYHLIVHPEFNERTTRTLKDNYLIVVEPGAVQDTKLDRGGYPFEITEYGNSLIDYVLKR